MKASLWHDLARQRPKAPPPCHSVDDIRQLGSGERETYLKTRTAWLRSLVFDVHPLRVARSRMSSVLELNEERPPGAKHIAVVDGPNTIGKSTLVRGWARDFYRDELGDRINDEQPPEWNPSARVRANEVPVVWINLNADALIKDVNTRILDFAGYPREGTIRSMNSRIFEVIDVHRVRLLVVDDVHLLNLNRANATRVLDHLKVLNTELGERGATLVLVGANLAGGQLVSDPQTSGRLRATRLSPQSLDSEEQMPEWQGLLSEFERVLLPHLPAAEAGLLSSTHALHIWRRTQGFFGDMSDLLSGAAILAGQDDAWTIRSTHLEQVTLSDRAELKEAELMARRQVRK